MIQSVSVAFVFVMGREFEGESWKLKFAEGDNVVEKLYWISWKASVRSDVGGSETWGADGVPTVS